MANTVNLSRWRFCHLFTEFMGTSPERFLTQVRLEQAKHLLAIIGMSLALMPLAMRI